jgi:hypothetical protein
MKKTSSFQKDRVEEYRISLMRKSINEKVMSTAGNPNFIANPENLKYLFKY